MNIFSTIPEYQKEERKRGSQPPDIRNNTIILERFAGVQDNTKVLINNSEPVEYYYEESYHSYKKLYFRYVLAENFGLLGSFNVKGEVKLYYDNVLR